MLFYDVLTQEYKRVPIRLMTQSSHIQKYVYESDIVLGSVIPETPTLGTLYPERGFHDKKCMMMIMFCKGNRCSYKVHSACYLRDSSMCMFSTYIEDQLVASYIAVSFKHTNVISLYVYTGDEMKLYNIELLVVKNTARNIQIDNVNKL